MKKIIFFFTLFLLSNTLFSQEEVKVKDGRTVILNSDGTWKYNQELPANNSFTDPRDGHVYKTVTIGTQTWMAENLAYKASSGCWAYNNDESNVATYGYLYNWETAKNVCPTSWHLPTDAEWIRLIDYLGGEDFAGVKLKTTSGWYENGNGTNSSGFSALPGSDCSSNGVFGNIGWAGVWWSSTEGSTSNAWGRILYFLSSGVSRSNSDKTYGLSVRCIKDK